MDYRLRRNDGKWLRGKLLSMRCAGHDSRPSKKAGGRPRKVKCSALVTIGLPYCPRHMCKEMGLAVKKSAITHAGLGVFAAMPGVKEGDVAFKKGDFICEYEGELLTEAEFEERYGVNGSSGYALEVKKDLFIDSSFHRYVSGLINHAPLRTANTRFAHSKGSTVVVKAAKTIRNGQEILVCYGSQYDWALKHSTKCR